jgi:predicted membrane metal-binding protein
MRKPSPIQDPPLGIGLASVIFGAVSLALFFMPVLSVPLGGVGVVFGLVGLLLALFSRWSSLRWSVVGIVVSALALGIAIAIAQAPEAYLPTRPASLDARPVRVPHYIPPPALPAA